MKTRNWNGRADSLVILTKIRRSPELQGKEHENQRDFDFTSETGVSFSVSFCTLILTAMKLHLKDGRNVNQRSFLHVDTSNQLAIFEVSVIRETPAALDFVVYLNWNFHQLLETGSLT